MATSLWSSLADGSVLAFDPNADVLRFDVPGGGVVAAAGIQFDPERVADSVFTLDGKTVTLLTAPRTLTTINVVFDGGAVLVVGDNTTGTAADDAGNTLSATGPIAPPAGSFLAGLGGDDSLFGWVADDVLQGGAGNDFVVGLQGADRLDGGPGDDLMRGDSGDDLYWVDSPGDQVVELPYDTFVGAHPIGTGGRDTVYVMFSYALPANVENAVLLVGGDLDLTGTAADNELRGAGGANVINAYAGDDYLYGGDGADRLYGGDGVDFLTGDAGDDLLDGGSGVDMAAYDSATSAVTVVLGLTTQDTGGAGVDTLADIEYLLGSAFDDALVGTDAANVLTGNGGADVIQGGWGDDWIEGDVSAFNGLFSGVSGGDVIDGGGGNDTILGGSGSDQLFGGGGVDTIVADDGDDVVYGGPDTDYIDGRAGADQLFGEDGADVVFGDNYPGTYGYASDTIRGGTGDDIIMGESGDHASPGALDVLYGDDGSDQLYGGGGDDWIYGGEGADAIDGGDGSDMILGGPGGDVMLGSDVSAYASATSGSDLFVYTSLADAGDGIWGFDVRAGNTDGIDLRPLFDALGYGGLTPRADGYLTVTGSYTPEDCVVWIDGDGGGDSFVQLVTLYGVAPAALTDGFFLLQ